MPEPPAPKTAEEAIKPEAILLIPGIGMDWCGDEVDSIGQKIAAALDHNAEPKARFSVSFTTRNFGQDTAPKLKTRVGTITRTMIKRRGDGNAIPTAGEGVRVLDLYGIGYDEALTGIYGGRSLVVKLFLLTFAIVGFLPLLARAMLLGRAKELKGRTGALLQAAKRSGKGQIVSLSSADAQEGALLQAAQRSTGKPKPGGYLRAKSTSEKVQLLLACGILLLLCVYLVVLLTALGQVIQAALLKVSSQQLRPGGPSWEVSLYDWWNAHAATAWLARISDFVRPLMRPAFDDAGAFFAFFGGHAGPVVILLTAIGALLPNRRNLQEGISKAAEEFLCMSYYLSMGDRRNVLVGHIAALIEDVCEQDAYSRVHVLGYSFGSIVALDALFPVLREPTPHFAAVDTLITVGCPLDAIRLFWPQYFRERRKLRHTPNRWLNVYSRVDVFSSNFNNKDQDQTESEYVLEFDQGWLKGLGAHEDACFATLPDPCHDRLRHAQPSTCPGDGVCKARAAGGFRTCFDRLAEDPRNCTVDCVQIKPDNVLFSDAASAKSLGVMGQLTLLGLRSHSMYWERPGEQEISCFDVLIPVLFKDHWLLTGGRGSGSDAAALPNANPTRPAPAPSVVSDHGTASPDAAGAAAATAAEGGEKPQLAPVA